MVSMISTSLKPAVTRLINPVARLAVRLGITPDAVTIFGAVGVVVSSGYFFTRESYFVGTLIVTLFVLSDLFDGAMARISDRGPSAWGGFLDSTIDRITDFSITIAILMPLIRHGDKLAYLGLISLITGLLIPYIRAKAESFSISCSIGIAERTERLILILVAVGLHGLHVQFALAIGLWLLATLGVITVIQRIVVVHQGLAKSD
jgi:CDP-diacylglycerol---glycerol-3-phosphate 3-phosphatidyltransferase